MGRFGGVHLERNLAHFRGREPAFEKLELIHPAIGVGRIIGAATEDKIIRAQAQAPGFGLRDGHRSGLGRRGKEAVLFLKDFAYFIAFIVTGTTGTLSIL